MLAEEHRPQIHVILTTPTVRNRNLVLNMSDETSDTRSNLARDRNSPGVRMLGVGAKPAVGSTL